MLYMRLGSFVPGFEAKAELKGKGRIRGLAS